MQLHSDDPSSQALGVPHSLWAVLCRCWVEDHQLHELHLGQCALPTKTVLILQTASLVGETDPCSLADLMAACLCGFFWFTPLLSHTHTCFHDWYWLLHVLPWLIYVSGANKCQLLVASSCLSAYFGTALEPGCDNSHSRDLSSWVSSGNIWDYRYSLVWGLTSHWSEHLIEII